MSDGNETRRHAGLPPALSTHRPELAGRLQDVDALAATLPQKSPVAASLTLPREGRRPLALFVLGCGDGTVVEILRQAMDRLGIAFTPGMEKEEIIQEIATRLPAGAEE